MPADNQIYQQPQNENDLAVWLPNLAAYDAASLLNYFRQRDNVAFFAVADAEETRRDKIDTILYHQFELNGEHHQLSHPVDWSHNPSHDLEWHVLLHKFYYAVGLGIAYQETGLADYRNCWLRLTDSWIAQATKDFCINPELAPERSQVTGRRIQNWIYAYYYFVHTDNSDNAALDADFHQRFLYSLHDQVEFLCLNLSPARNHRTLELYAIFLAAVVFPEFRAASSWLNLARQGIIDNISTDLLNDGVQCELSTDYHHLVLKNYLCVRRLAQLNSISLPAEVDAALIKALEFSMFIHKPDGIVPALSDGDARSHLELLQQGHELFGRKDMLYVATQGGEGSPPEQRCRGFTDSGYYILRSGWGSTEAYEDERYLVFDCGPLGEGNHGHFDLLNIELAAYGRSLIVDPGRYTYDESGSFNWRAKFRSTTAHNTVVVDGKNQTRYGPKAGKKRYKILGPAPNFELRAFSLANNNRCFDYLHGVAKSAEYDAVHARQIFFVDGEYWLIVDTLSAPYVHDYALTFHLGEQSLAAIKQSRRNATLTVASEHLLLAQPVTTGITTKIDEDFISHRYGHKQVAPCLRFCQHANNARFITVAFPFKTTAPELAIKQLTTDQLTVAIQRDTDHFIDHYQLTDQPKVERHYERVCDYA